ncbi:MAG: alpha-N-arabinofuranosidase [Bryobacteraceae bacterium]|jgi:alpha-N-arabinofuranosidase
MPRKALPLVLFAALAAAGTGTQTSNSPEQRIAVTVDAGKTRAPISPYLYGQFIEHIGDLVNRSVWTEMLDDRKFYYAVNSETAPPSPTRPGPLRGRRANRWRPIGPDSAVVMDRDRPYVGEHTPLIKLSGNDPCGIQQAGLVLRKSKVYSGRVVLAGEPGAAVGVSLVWGSGPRERQTIPMTDLRSDYAKFPLQFTAGGDTDNGRIEIAATGTGSFHVGAVSLMPADNIRGFRPDVIALLKQLRSGMYRFPGGNFLSAHEWRDAIGDPDRRPPRWDYVWSALQPNDVGTDEFLTLCDLLGVDAFISVNAGFGDAHSAAQLVEYVNGAADTPMGKLRAANGHPAPYNVKWWGIGNEMYGTWQFGYMAPQQYVIKHNMFAKAMHAVDPTITLLATGATPDEMTVNRLSVGLTGKVAPDYGSDADFTGLLLANCLDSIDVMSEHFYSYDRERFDLEQNKRVPIEEPLPEAAYRAANRVRDKVEAYEEYARRIPGLQKKHLTIAIDEWALTRLPANLKQTLANAVVFHEMFRHTDLIQMAGHTMGTSSIEFNATEAALNTTGLLFQLYRDHFGTVPVEVDGNSPPPPPKYPVGGDQPKVNASSPTYPLDVSASLTSDGKFLTVAVVNPTESVQKLDLTINGVDLRGQGRFWRLTGSGINAVTGLSRHEVQVVEMPLGEVPKRLEVAPISVELYEFERR